MKYRFKIRICYLAVFLIVGVSSLFCSATNIRSGLVESKTNRLPKKLVQYSERGFIQLVETGAFKEALGYLEKLLKDVKKPSSDLLKGMLMVYYNNGRKNSFKAVLNKYPELKSGYGKHHYFIAMHFASTGDIRRFFLHSLKFIQDKNRVYKRYFRHGLFNFKKQSYSAALSYFDRIKTPSASDRELILRIKTFIFLRQKKYLEAYNEVKKFMVVKTNLDIKNMQLLFSLSLLNKDGPAAVYWGKKISRKIPAFLKQYEFLNNFSMAYIYHYKNATDSTLKKTAIRHALRFATSAMALRRIAPVLHTASLANELAGNIKQAVKLMTLVRSLKPRDIHYKKRLQTLLKKSRKLRN